MKANPGNPILGGFLRGNERKTPCQRTSRNYAENISESSHDEKLFEVGSREYPVLTDDEATERAREYIADSLWAFNASFLSGYTGLDEAVFTALQPQCESSNDAVRSLITGTGHDLDDFADEAISADGRGHFMSSYDGEENEQGDYFIYRVN